MSKLYRLGDGRSRTGKVLNANTIWFESELGLMKHIEENPSDASKTLYVSINGRAYVETSIGKVLNRINHMLMAAQ